MSEPKDGKIGWGLHHLRAGDCIRLFEGGPERQVTRVTTGAAYYEVLKEKTYGVFDTKEGAEKEITRKERKTEYISSFSYVELISRDPDYKSVSLLPNMTPKPVDPTAEAKVPLPPIEYTKSKRRK